MLCMGSKHLIQSRELSSCCSCRLELGLSWAHALAGAGNRLKPFWLCISVNDWGSQVGFWCYLCLAELYFPVKGTRAEFLSHSGISAPALCLLGDGIRVRKQWERWRKHQEGGIVPPGPAQRGPCHPGVGWLSCLRERVTVGHQMCLWQSRCDDDDDEMCIYLVSSFPLLPAPCCYQSALNEYSWGVLEKGLCLEAASLAPTSHQAFYSWVL